MSSRKHETGAKDNSENGSVTPVEISEKERQDMFERELAWCIEQVELGLKNSKKPTGKQAQEAVRILKVLRNPAAPLVKKRQVMRNSFGDYRKKMEEEQRKYSLTAKSISLKVGNRDSKKKAQFLRKCTLYSELKRPDRRENTGDNSSSYVALSGAQSNSGFQWASLTQDSVDTFKFGFNVEETREVCGQEEEVCGQEQEMDKSGACPLVANAGRQLDRMSLNSSEQPQSDSPQEPSSDLHVTGSQQMSVNYYKLPTSDNTFRFNFDVS